MVTSVQNQKICFVITPIGAPGSLTRKNSDQVFKHIILKALQPLDYIPMRADQIHEPGIITSQIVQQIVEAPLGIADLSERNPNVFYELAIRHVTKKPLITLMTENETIPFDVAGTRIIRYDLGDLDSIDRAREEAILHSRALRNNPTTEPRWNQSNLL